MEKPVKGSAVANDTGNPAAQGGFETRRYELD